MSKNNLENNSVYCTYPRSIMKPPKSPDSTLGESTPGSRKGNLKVTFIDTAKSLPLHTVLKYNSSKKCIPGTKNKCCQIF